MKYRDTIVTPILITAFEAALSDGREQVIHTFLEINPQVLTFLFWRGFVKSKFRLADAYVPDFVTVGVEPWSNAIVPLVTFVEIERANEPLFTQTGNPTSFLTHAIRQVQDWKQWVRDNRSYLQGVLHKEIIARGDDSNPPRKGDNLLVRALHDGFRFMDRYLVVAGRRASMRESERLRLTQMVGDLHAIQVITYDAILEGLRLQVEHGPSGIFPGTVSD